MAGHKIAGFLKSVFSGANNHWSSKRLVGTSCFMFVFTTFLYIKIKGDVLTNEEVKLFETILYMGAALLGSGVFEKKYGRGKEDGISERHE